MSSLRFISFFAGIGGIDLGLERAGHKCVGQVEINPFCQQVLAKHWPDTWRHDDITTLKPEDIPAADLWTGGFPCQDISLAGRGDGITGSRSGLFFDWMRSVRVVRPERMLLENVAALLHRGMGEVCGALAESGYDTEWDCIPAGALGLPHVRDRVFVAANSNRKRLQGRANERGRGGVWPRAKQQLERLVPAGDGLDISPRGFSGDRHGLQDRMDRSQACGNAVVPQVAEYIGRLLGDAT